MENQPCRGLPHRAGLALAGLWCLLSPSLEYVTYGGGWVVLQHGLELCTRCNGSGASQEVEAKVSHSCVLPGSSGHDLQSDLQVATTCAGLGGAQVKPSCEPRLIADSARPGAT